MLDDRVGRQAAGFEFSGAGLAMRGVGVLYHTLCHATRGASVCCHGVYHTLYHAVRGGSVVYHVLHRARSRCYHVVYHARSRCYHILYHAMRGIRALYHALYHAMRGIRALYHALYPTRRALDRRIGRGAAARVSEGPRSAEIDAQEHVGRCLLTARSGLDEGLRPATGEVEAGEMTSLKDLVEVVACRPEATGDRARSADESMRLADESIDDGLSISPGRLETVAPKEGQRGLEADLVERFDRSAADFAEDRP